MKVQNKKNNLVSEFRKSFTKKFEDIKGKLEPKDRMRIALELDISLVTVERYLGGEVRRLELAESILSTAKEVLRLKEKAASEAV